MKRNVNDFEKRLLEKGWVLDSKKYYGKHSQRVLCYTYKKEFDSLFGKVFGYVDYRKCDNAILNIYVDNKLGGFVGGFELDGITTLLKKINDEVIPSLYY